MICSGLDVSSSSFLDIEYGRSIASVTKTEVIGGDVYLAPGFIDLQVNGFAGVDYNSPHTSIEEIARSIHALFASGVTRFYPTVITGAPDEMAGALRNLSRAKEELAEGVAIEGFHVEGPHISPEDGPRGAHPLRWVRPPDIDEYRRWQEATGGLIRLVTLSPHWPEAPKYIEAVAQDGVTVSVGHTDADGRRISDAVSAGATMSTHLGNGAHQVLPRHPNYIWEQLAEDRLTAGFIVDGIHLPASFLRVALRAKGVERSVLVTDASSPAGAPPGRYKLGEQEVDLTADQRVVLAGQDRLAGSALRMHHGIEKLMNIARLTLRDAVQMATINPARIGRIANRQNGLVAGDRADFVVFRFDDEAKRIDVRATYVDGEKVWRSTSAA